MIDKQDTFSTEGSKNVVKFLKWVGILALASVPVVLVLKKLASRRADSVDDDGSNIFAEELSQ